MIAYPVFFADTHPGIFLGLLDPKRNFLALAVKIQNQAFDFIRDFKDFGRMRHTLGPGKLTDMDKPFNSRLELHKRAVMENINDFALHLSADRVTVSNLIPGIR